MRAFSSLLHILPLVLMSSFPVQGQPLLPTDGMLVIDSNKVPKETPPVYRVDTVTSFTPSDREIRGSIQGTVTVLQGFPETYSIGLTGPLEIESLTGEGIVSWALRRQQDGSHLLDIVVPPASPEQRTQKTPAPAAPLKFQANFRMPLLPVGLPTELTLSLPSPGAAAGFSGLVRLQSGPGVEWQVLQTNGLYRVEGDAPHTFQSTGVPSLRVRAAQTGSLPPAAELRGASLLGVFDPKNKVASFVLEGTVEVREQNARLPILAGRAAITGPVGEANWRLLIQDPSAQSARETKQEKSAALPPVYELQFDGPGVYAVRIPFDAAVMEFEGWQRLDFRIPASGVVPVKLGGLPGNLEFLETAAVIPMLRDGTMEAWLPASGMLDAAWRAIRESGSGRLFVNSHARIDIAAGPGMLRQQARFDLRILQGRLETLAFQLEGEGEITGVSGTNVGGWKVTGTGASRKLEITLSRPVDVEAAYAITSQTPVGDAGTAITPIRATPIAGEVRHSGLVRIRNDGAVRFDTIDLAGLMQLAPSQWGKERETPSGQVSLYRFPSPDYRLALSTRQVFPEVTVNQVTIYELAETDRVIDAKLELDIREAPLREWTLGIPEGYAVTSLTGTSVADSMPGELRDGIRPLRITFSGPLEGRALLSLRLERSEPAAAGRWNLPPLSFPDARAVRGFVGVVSAPGYRLAASGVDGLSETPLNFFPDQRRGLQQAFRQRDAAWTAAMDIEALGQSVAADLFHLYSLKEGVAYGSVVLNFFVVGAPVNEWRITVPESAGNLVIDGQDVQSWRREGGDVIVSLNRPALGAATLLATFEHPMSTEGGRLELGTIQPVGAASERGYVQIVSPLQVKSKTESSDSLLRIEPNELPPELRLLSNAPSIAVFEYAARPFQLSLDVEWFEQAESVPQVVDFAQLETRVSRDGQVVTDAKYFVKSRGTPSLRLTLPEDSSLWEVRVNDVTVNARSEEAFTLVPLPPGIDPDTAVNISIRYGWSSKSASRIRLAAPEVAAPVLAMQWTAKGEAGRILVPGRSPILNPSRVLTENGFEWIGQKGRSVLFWMLAAGSLITLLLARFASRHTAVRVLAILALLGTIAVFGIGALVALSERGVNSTQLQLTAPITTDGRPVFIDIMNLSGTFAMLSWTGLFLIAAGLLLFFAGKIFRAGLLRFAALPGWALVGVGLLLQHGGAAFFFAWAALSLAIAAGPAILRKGKGRPQPPSINPGTAAAATLWILLAAAAIILPAASALAAEIRVLETVDQSIEITETQASVTANVSVNARAGDSFPLLHSPAILTGFEGEGLRLSKVDTGKGPVYHVTAATAGRFTAVLRYTLTLPDGAGQFRLPTGASAANRVTLSRNEPGWGFSSPSAVRTENPDAASKDLSRAILVLAPAAEQMIQIHPRRRDAATETLLFFSESQNLFVPGPGVVDGRHKLRLRVSQGEMRELAVSIPDGFMVGSVGGELFAGRPADWRFDPDAKRLSIALPVPQRGNFEIEFATQRVTGNLPVDIPLAPPRVEKAADETGALALAFGNDAQPDTVTPTDLTRINLEDLDPALLATFAEGERPQLHRVFQFGKTGGSLAARVTAVEPEIRVVATQILSIGSERVLLAIDLETDIRRTGVFQLAFPVPAGMEVETVTGSALSHWTETGGDQRRVVMHLKERTVGSAMFHVTLTAPPPGANAAWEIPRFRLENSERASGQLTIVPEQGLRVRTITRENASQIDTRETTQSSKPGTLAFRLLQSDWKLVVGIDELEPWITAQMLHETQLREGQARHRVAFRFKVENASVKTLRVRLPGLNAETAETVRAEGEAVGDIQRVGETDEWELRFRRGMIGDVPVTIDYQQRLDTEKAGFEFVPARPAAVRQLSAYAALRATGRLEVLPGQLPAGWQKVDWNAVPATLRDATDSGVLSGVFRISDAAETLQVATRRQAIADALKLRVSKGEFATVFSAMGDSATAARLEVRVMEKSAITLRLPESARMFQVSVNDEATAVVRDGNTHLFYVMPGPDPTQPSIVTFAYEVPGGKKSLRHVQFAAPAFNIPLENINWRLFIPDGWRMDGHSGTMVLQRTGSLGGFGLEDYLSLSVARKKSQATSTTNLMSEASDWLRKGEQEKARIALNRASKTQGVDAATNEDARVQLRNLYNQQAVLGLNTRRQKLYLDNSSRDASVVNDQIEQAARANPLLQGRTEYDLGQMDQFLTGNTIEETGALRRVADRIVSQQIAAEPAPRAIALTLPEKGTEAAFTRTVQVDGEAPLVLEIGITRIGGGMGNFLTLSLTILLIGAIGGFAVRRP